MKTLNILSMATLVGGLFALSAHVSVAQTAERISAAKDILTKTPKAQIASKAAQLVANAPTKEKAAVASAVAHAAASINADLASAAVAAIASSAPAVAPAAAAAAASGLPDSAPAMALAAADVPGVKANDVRAAVIAAVPRQAAQVVSALSRAKHGASLLPRAAAVSVAASGASSGCRNMGVF